MAYAGSAARYPLERRTFHKLKVKNDIFEIDTRYTKAKYIGGGAYGTVIAAWDEVRRAVKRCINLAFMALRAR